MSRWSRLWTDSRLVALLLFATAALQPLTAQLTASPEVPATALLQLGPRSARGIDLIAPDLTPHWYGRYRVGGALLEVYYVREPLPKTADWAATPCLPRALRAREPGLVYFEGSGSPPWSLLVHLLEGELPPTVSLCSFVDSFVETHLLFEGLEGVQVPGTAPIFPAVIEL